MDKSIELEHARIQAKLGTNLAEAEKFFSQSTEPSFAARQFVLLTDYHSHSLAQSKISFWFSLLSAAFGFLVIIAAIVLLKTETTYTLVTLIAGTVIEAVSALFFVQSNKARELMAGFFDRLRADRKLEEALNLAEKIEDITVRSRLQLLLSLNFADAPGDTEVLGLLLGAEIRHGSANSINKDPPTT